MILILGIVTLVSCRALTPIEFSETLPKFTESKFFNLSFADNLLAADNCTILVNSRTYVAPVGITSKNDIKNAARGIDEWVKLDGGNAYRLINYKWVTIDENGTSQLHIEFDTMKCKE